VTEDRSFLGPNGVSHAPHLRKETDPVSETLYFLEFIIPDDGKCPEIQ
jgi:hypothetical protein